MVPNRPQNRTARTSEKAECLRRVLVVEDVAEMRELLKQVLSAIPGLSVSGLAQNGWEARVELSRQRPDVVLLDEILPGESSYDLLQEFLAQQVPVILLTGVRDPVHPVFAGALGRVTKPGWDSMDMDRRRMGESIKDLLSRKSPDRRS